MEQTMANRTHGTRQKMVFRVPLAKPRNVFALQARQKAAGAHRKDRGALRAAERRVVKKLLGEGE